MDHTPLRLHALTGTTRRPEAGAAHNLSGPQPSQQQKWTTPVPFRYRSLDAFFFLLFVAVLGGHTADAEGEGGGWCHMPEKLPLRGVGQNLK